VNSYRETLRYLYSLQHRGMKFGLRNTTMLLRALGNPERQFPSIHIAGTNGKGSTASFLASIGTESGYATGLYTSPHLIRFTERIRIDGKEMPEDRLVQYVRMLRRAMSLGGFYQVIFICHAPQIWELADRILTIRDGRVFLQQTVMLEDLEPIASTH